MRVLVLMTLLAIGFIGCSDPAESPRVMAPLVVPEKPPEQKVEKTQSMGLKFGYNSKIDILFVVDDSRSMTNEIKTLQDNILNFVKEFSKNNIMDYQIGVVTVFDSVRYIDSKQQVLEENHLLQKRNYYESGELRPLIDKKGLQLLTSRRFVTKKNLKDLVPLFSLDTEFIDDNVIDEETGEIKVYAKGPAYEESFSPIRQLLFNPELDRTSRGFIRDDAYLVIIFLTDAEDSSPKDDVVAFENMADKYLISPKQFYNEILLKKKDPSLISAFGLLCPIKNSEACRKTEPDNPESIVKERKSFRIREFIGIVHRRQREGQNDLGTSFTPILDIGSKDWGKQLASIGTEIRKNMLEKKIPLASGTYPEYDPIKGKVLIEIKYGNKILTQGKDWRYFAPKNEVIIFPNLSEEVLSQEGAQFSIQYFKVDRTLETTIKL